MCTEDNRPCLLIYKEHEDAKIPTIAYNNTSACFDLQSIEDVVIPARGTNMCGVGLRFIIPEGWEIVFRNRSSLGIKNNLQVHSGTIDAGYKGPLGIKFYNHGDVDYKISKGDKIVQCAMRSVPSIRMIEITKDRFEKEDTDRGENGFGSSGR